ncbi:aminotransferase class V-fold PLP-dependent enzyme, partial [Campylobacter concisus]|uniref:aminotransferase class V-fold PLP-dependent enzyme n=1 Tax=Campylobacter concisus TaxID=199 RepID=UPI00112FCD0F
LETAKAECTDYRGEGYSIMEISHRSKTFEEIHFGAMDKIRKLYGIGDEYEILFLQGGAHLQFGMIPMNLYQGGKAEYANTGVWTNKAIKEAKVLGVTVDVVASNEDETFSYIPQFKVHDEADYAYTCSNNPVYAMPHNATPNH